MKTAKQQPSVLPKRKPSELPNAMAVVVRRVVRACKCEYQKEKKWGYGCFKWIGGRKSWKRIRSAMMPDMTELLCRPYKTVLVVCLGCGSDIVREYRPNE